MEIIAHHALTLVSPNDVYNLFHVPLWEIEIQSPNLHNAKFAEDLNNTANYVVSHEHGTELRSRCINDDLIDYYLGNDCKEMLLDLVFTNPATLGQYNMPREHYSKHTKWFATILKDQPGLKMTPHLDNHHIMVQLIVNLLQDNETSTTFHYVNDLHAVYQAPTKQNHGVVFVNTPGAVHSIQGITKPRWILYAGIFL